MSEKKSKVRQLYENCLGYVTGMGDKTTELLSVSLASRIDKEL